MPNLLPTKEKRLKKSGLYMPDHLNEKLYTKKTRKIWTPDGEFDVPIKRKKHQMIMGTVKGVWMKNDEGQPIMYDPAGEANTVTNGAIYEMMQVLYGQFMGINGGGLTVTYGSTSTALSVLSATGNVVSNRAAYNDGTYNFPNLSYMSSTYSTSTYYTVADIMRPFLSLFGQVWFVNGSSGGLVGSHIGAPVTVGAAFANSYLTGSLAPTLKGWNDANGIPTSATSGTLGTLTDSYSLSNSGTPTATHVMTLGAASNALTYTFDGIAWVPVVGLGNSTSFRGAGSYWSGNTSTPSVPLVASSSASPTSISNLMVSALWTPGYATVMSANSSWGFTYSFQG